MTKPSEPTNLEQLVDTWRSAFREGMAVAFQRAIAAGGDVNAIRAAMHRSCSPLQPRTTCPHPNCSKKDDP
jgi:hypothetical protein